MSGAPVTAKHRELAKKVFRTPHQYMSQNDDQDLAQAIADAEARGYEAGIREAAKLLRKAADRISDTTGDYYQRGRQTALRDSAHAILALLPEVTK